MALLDILRHPDLRTVLKEYCGEWLAHPRGMAREHVKYSSRWLLGIEDTPENSVLFENHCHSHFSDGPELSNVVDTLFEKGISIWSLTDHNNSKAFDALASGAYVLGEEYEIEFGQDKRHLVIHSEDHHLAMLRSMELMTDKGEIGVHGYEGNFPAGRIPLKEAIERAIDMGGYAVINHPHYVNLSIGSHDAIEEAVDAGALAFEKNGVEIPPLIYSAVRAGLDAEHYDLPLVAGGDAHTVEMYGKSGIAFNEDAYLMMLIAHNGRQSDTIRELISADSFENYLNYLTPLEFLRFASRVPDVIF